MHFQEFSLPIGQHHSLNDKIWLDQDQIKPEVRAALIQIARSFKEFVDIPFLIKDLQITGAQANYTYTKFSDLDLHLIVDFDTIPDCGQELKLLFDTKRRLWNQQHDVTVFGIPVEIYVEDLKEPVEGSAYSLIQQQWIRTPEKLSTPVDKQEFEQDLKKWKKIIDMAIASDNLKLLKYTMDLLKKYRKTGLNSKQKEYSTANLVFKSLRNSKYIEKLKSHTDQIYDKKFSINN